MCSLTHADLDSILATKTEDRRRILPPSEEGGASVCSSDYRAAEILHQPFGQNYPRDGEATFVDNFVCIINVHIHVFY